MLKMLNIMLVKKLHRTEILRLSKIVSVIVLLFLFLAFHPNSLHEMSNLFPWKNKYNIFRYVIC